MDTMHTYDELKLAVCDERKMHRVVVVMIQIYGYTSILRVGSTIGGVMLQS